MTGPRFLLLQLPVAVPAAGVRAGLAGARTAWRLVAGNNHVLGRVPEPLEDLDACRAALERLRQELDALTAVDHPASRPGRRGWQLLLGGEAVAVSSRWYERQREALRALDHFRTAVPVARTSATVAVRPRRREVRRPDLQLPRTDPSGDA